MLTPPDMDLGKPQYPIGDLHGNPHQFRELDETLLLAISEFSGGNSRLIQQTMHLMPYFTLFHTIYVRVIVKSEDYMSKSPLSKSNIDYDGGNRDWVVSKEDFTMEYNQFVYKVSKERGIGFDEALDDLASQNMGPETRDRFYEYFTGADLPSDNISGTGSCAWPLGCVQNISDIDDMAEELGSEKEHSRPKSLRDGQPNQRMCAIHNRWKGNNLLFDVIGILYCVFGDNSSAED